MIIDLHAQTRVAKQSQAPATLIEAAKEAGLDGIAFVERLRSSHTKSLLAAGEAADFPVFVGVEIPTSHGALLCFAPDLDPFISREEWRQLMVTSMAPSVERVLALFESVGGAVLAAQPYVRKDGVRMGDTIVYHDGLHGVEALTGSASYLETALAVEVAVKLGLPVAGGSETLRQLGDIGRHATLFPGHFNTQADFVKALRDGEYWGIALGDGPPKRSSRRPERRDGGDRDRRGGSRDGGRRRRRPGPRRGR